MLMVNSRSKQQIAGAAIGLLMSLAVATSAATQTAAPHPSDPNRPTAAPPTLTGLSKPALQNAIAQVSPASQADIQALEVLLNQLRARVAALESALANNTQAITDTRFAANTPIVWVKNNGATVMGVVRAYPGHVHSFRQVELKWHNSTCFSGYSGESGTTVPCSYINVFDTYPDTTLAADVKPMVPSPAAKGEPPPGH